MKAVITYLAHSGVLAELGGTALLFDYYTGTLPRAAFARAERALVFTSHAHADHYQSVIHTLKRDNPHTRFFLSYDIDAPADVSLSPGDTAEADGITVRAFGSTDAGVSFLVNCSGVFLFHAGDLNLWSWKEESTPTEVAQATDDFHAILAEVAAYPADAAFFPWDPRMRTDFAQGFEEYQAAVRPRFLMPIHFGQHYALLEEYARAHLFPGTQLMVPTHPNDTFAPDITPISKGECI